MWPDGICRVTDTRYTKTIQYQDINYQLSQNEDKTAIFEAWCDFLNYFDSSVQFQLSFVNLSASQETFARSISIPPCGDEFDGIRAEYAGMLQNQLARGNNGLIKTKYLTFGVEADNLRAAKPRLERIETDLLNNFKRLGVVAAPLNGFERLHVMHDILRMDEQEPFRFSWDWLPPSGLSTKDFIAPSSFEFKTGRMFRMGKKLGAISFVQILAPELNDRMLADFLDMESSVLVNLHVQSVDQVNAIKTVKRKITDLFKEVADIKTADQLHLPTPEVAYHTIATKPTQIQQDMVKALSERASKVHSGAVSPDVDNMLKITSDGRKLGLDQRIINPMLPDEETTKVNQCVANILQYWRDGEEEKLTQLVFCDISTPKTTPSQRAAKASPGTLDSPEIHALESAIPLEESSDTPFTVYEDVRQKLIDAGMPPEQIAFIHDANTEVKKRELFAKVRSGQVRVLMGSTAKMGAGTNVQDRLVALHDLDCPWRPRDLTQRKGRIERQGNQNKLVHVCRYVTEGTFDAYLWQTVENKQKFISQIMTSKSPVRSCEDVDATALSFAEIKALCAGDPRIKERMDLDIEVSKLKIMKADHNSKQFRLEDSLLKYFPEKIEEHKGFVRGLDADMQTLAAHPLPAEGFVGMEIRGDRLTDKENAGAALLDTCKEVKGKDPVQIGSYRGFTMSVAFDSMWKTYTLTLKGQMTHRVELGSDARGNLVRIARCILKDAPIVILDEATASVDTDNESYIQEAINELVKGKTLLVIAHRLNTIRQADQILVISDGRISEQGTHDELMAKAGIYQDFVNIRKKSSGWSLA